MYCVLANFGQPDHVSLIFEYHECFNLVENFTVNFGHSAYTMICKQRNANLRANVQVERGRIHSSSRDKETASPVPGKLLLWMTWKNLRKLE